MGLSILLSKEPALNFVHFLYGLFSISLLSSIIFVTSFLFYQLLV